MIPSVALCRLPRFVPHRGRLAGRTMTKLPGSLTVIQRELGRVEQTLSEMLSSAEPAVQEFMAHMSTYRGKRLRPALVLLSGKACGDLTETHTQVAAVVELVHTATLIHDDIVDGAVVRRHRPSANEQWGAATSVLLGDLVLSRALELLPRIGCHETTRLLAEATRAMCEGEIAQVRHRFELDLSEEAYLDIIGRKTASLFQCACRLGSLHSGGPPAQQDALAEYGRLMGIAFQISDDCLDITGEEKIVGKTLRTDLQKGKLTLPLIRLIQQTPRQDRAGIRELAFPGDSQPLRERLIAELQSAGAMKYAAQVAARYAGESRRAIEPLPDSQWKNALIELANYTARRER